MRTERTSCGSKLALRWSGSRHSASLVRLVRKNCTMRHKKWLKWSSKTLPAPPPPQDPTCAQKIMAIASTCALLPRAAGRVSATTTMSLWMPPTAVQSRAAWLATDPAWTSSRASPLRNSVMGMSTATTTRMKTVSQGNENKWKICCF